MEFMDKERIISGLPHEEEQNIELNLRPKRLQEYIGQSQVKQNLEIALKAIYLSINYSKSSPKSKIN